MTHKEIIEHIDALLIQNLQSKCEPTAIKRHGICEVKYIQSESDTLLYSYSDKKKVSLDSKFKLQILHIQEQGRVENQQYGVNRDSEYKIDGKLVLVGYSHSILHATLHAFEQMDNIFLESFNTNSEDNVRRIFRIKKDEKNYNPETRIFVFNYKASFNL